MLHFSTPWKHQKTSGFLTFSGEIEIQYEVSNIRSEICRGFLNITDQKIILKHFIHNIVPDT